MLPVVKPIVLLLLLVLPAAAAAQQGTTELRGTLRDAQGGAVPGVAGVVRNQDTGTFRETASNADGTYFISGLVPGTYEITAELSGFKRSTQRDARLEVGRTAAIDITLQIGALTESITVTGRTTGAISNAVTKQGTNVFRGSAFGYFQDAAMTERDYFATVG